MLLACQKDDNGIPKGECAPAPAPAGSYLYPVTPGSSAWAALTTGDAKMAACQIPNTVLTNMSTDVLIQAWLDFPLRLDVLLSNYLQTGIDFFLKNFSALVELQKRTDMEDVASARYKLMKPTCASSYGENQKGDFALSFFYLELIMAQDTFLNNSTSPVRKAIVKEALFKYIDKKANNTVFGDQPSITTTMLLCARAMKSDNYQPFIDLMNNSNTIKLLVKTGYPEAPVTHPDLLLLIEKASTYIK